MASIGSSNSSKEGSGSGSGSGSVSSNMSRAQILTHPGDYFFVNPRTTMQDADLTQLLTAVQAQNITIVGPFTTDNYAFAAQQVRTAGEAGEYSCGDIITPDFFDEDKMNYTMNYIILRVSERGSQHSMVTQHGGRNFTTNAFVILRDLNRMVTIRAAIVQKSEQESSVPLKNHEYFKFVDKKEAEPFLYIEGLCANRAAGRGAGMQLMDKVHASAFTANKQERVIYQGCKLSALVYVIQFYFNKFSYRFRKACESDPAQYEDLNRDINKLPRLRNDDEAKFATGWLKLLINLTEAGFNTEVSKSTAERILSLRDGAGIIIYNDDDDPDAVDVIPVERLKRYVQAFSRAGWDDQGYTMYFCFYHNPTLGIPCPRASPVTKMIIDEAGSHVGSGRQAAQKQRAANLKALGVGVVQGGRKRRRRRRTKKRALKKKHRRTRRRRKRKTRRKRRGGKHKKPSRKHCKKLRHQHRQLAHGLHRVSQAINVQCGMHGGYSYTGTSESSK